MKHSAQRTDQGVEAKELIGLDMPATHSLHSQAMLGLVMPTTGGLVRPGY